jgi:membrane protease YdiL (CAAX protease family)
LDEIIIPETDKKACLQCEALISASGKFCPFCGARQIAIAPLSFENRWTLLQQAALFYGIHVIICAATKLIPFFDTLMWNWVAEIALWITSLAFFADKWADNKILFKWRSFSPPKLAACLAIAMAGGMVVHYAAGWLNVTLFPKDEDLYLYAGHKAWVAIKVVFFTAITPALFEEIGFRGYLLNALLKITDGPQAIYISAFLFAILHLSFLSLFWLIPFAIFIGYLRLKENTLWYGIFFHFAFNLTACIFELV